MIRAVVVAPEPPPGRAQAHENRHGSSAIEIPLDLTGDVDVGEALDQLLEEDLHLEAGQVGTEAEVRAAAAERHVLVG